MKKVTYNHDRQWASSSSGNDYEGETRWVNETCCGYGREVRTEVAEKIENGQVLTDVKKCMIGK